MSGSPGTNEGPPGSALQAVGTVADKKVMGGGRGKGGGEVRGTPEGALGTAWRRARGSLRGKAPGWGVGGGES